MSQRSCMGCGHCYCEPDDDPVCGHPDSGTFGLYIARGPVPHCGRERAKFVAHPRRNEDGTMKAK